MRKQTTNFSARALLIVGASVLCVMAAAALQHTVVLGVALAPHMFVVPVAVGLTFGVGLVWARQVAATNVAQAELLRDREQQILSINQDLEARVDAATEELTRKQEELLQSQKLEIVGHLAGGIAHDLNNLLTVVVTNASMIEADADDTEQKELAAEILHACERGADLTRRLMSTAQARDAARTPQQVAAVVDRLLPLLDRALPRSIQLHATHSPAPDVLLSSAQLDQVLLNLVLNARDAMPDGGTIEVRTHLQPGPTGARRVVLEVEDQGCGIPPDVAARVFEPFFTTKPDGVGTGLGLPTVKGIVEAWGGELTLTTSSDGTCFRAWFPVHSASDQQAPLTAAP